MVSLAYNGLSEIRQDKGRASGTVTVNENLLQPQAISIPRYSQNVRIGSAFYAVGQ